jgi:hypothetical protein
MRWGPMINSTLRGLTALMLLCLPGVLLAAVSLSSDRNPVRVNESFTLTIQLDGDEDGEPDLAPLATVVDVLGTSQETRTTVVNRQVQTLSSWHVSVMARKSGDLLIEPVRIGKTQTNSLTIQVQDQDTGPRSEQNIYLEVEAEPKTPYVQQEVLYTVRLVSAVVTADERLSEPSILAGEALVEQLGDRKIYTVQRGARTLRVIESTYAVFPQKSGKLELDKIQALVRVFDTSSGQWSLLSRRPSEFRLTGDPVSLEVRPIPASYPARPWLPAASLRLEETITDGPYREGEPFTRTVRLVAQGLTSGQLPEIPLPSPPDLRTYPDRPVFSNQLLDGHLGGSREQRIAFIPSKAGDLVLPELKIPWWNTVEDRLEYAELPRKSLKVLPSAVARDNQPGTGDALASGPQAQTDSALWKGTTAAAVVAWLLTLWAWFTRKSLPGHGPATGTPAAESIKTAQRKLAAACKSGEAKVARERLDRFLRLKFPDLGPQNAMTLLATRVPRLALEFRELDRFLYGPMAEPGRAPWHGDGLWRHLCAALEIQPYAESGEGLKALYPDPGSAG